MAKYPELGQVKTRLASSVGEHVALNIYIDLLKNVIKSCNSSDNNNYQFGVFVTPEDELNSFKAKYPNLNFYFAQSEGNLGTRMKNALNHLFTNKNTEKVILIGSDIPDLNENIIKKGLELLDNNDIVYGPTEDGGYYLIGMKNIYSCLFENIPWGNYDVLSLSLDIADSNNISYYLLESLPDLDTIDDLKSFPFLYEKYINKKTGL